MANKVNFTLPIGLYNNYDEFNNKLEQMQLKLIVEIKKIVLNDFEMMGNGKFDNLLTPKQKNELEELLKNELNSLSQNKFNEWVNINVFYIISGLESALYALEMSGFFNYKSQTKLTRFIYNNIIYQLSDDRMPSIMDDFFENKFD
jgi:hypothetical protein